MGGLALKTALITDPKADWARGPRYPGEGQGEGQERDPWILKHHDTIATWLGFPIGKIGNTGPYLPFRGNIGIFNYYLKAILKGLLNTF